MSAVVDIYTQMYSGCGLTRQKQYGRHGHKAGRQPELKHKQHWVMQTVVAGHVWRLLCCCTHPHDALTVLVITKHGQSLDGTTMSNGPITNGCWGKRWELLLHSRCYVTIFTRQQ